MSFPNIPIELVYHIATLLEPQDFHSLRLICSQIYQKTDYNSKENVWVLAFLPTQQGLDKIISYLTHTRNHADRVSRLVIAVPRVDIEDQQHYKPEICDEYYVYHLKDAINTAIGIEPLGDIDEVYKDW